MQSLTDWFRQLRSITAVAEPVKPNTNAPGTSCEAKPFVAGPKRPKRQIRTAMGTQVNLVCVNLVCVAATCSKAAPVSTTEIIPIFHVL